MVSRKHLSMALAAALVFAACGGGGSIVTTEAEAPQGTAAVPESTVPQTDPATTQPASSGEFVLCESPAPTEIGTGASVEGANSDDLPTVCFWVEIPDGLASVAFELDGLAANLDLAVGYGFARVLIFHTGEFWPSREDGTTAETIELENPKAGPYFITVGPSGFEDFSSFSLSVTTEPAITAAPTGGALPDSNTCGGPVTVLAIGESAEGEVVARNTSPEPRAYYCVEVPAGVGALTVDLSGLTGDLDLFVEATAVGAFATDRSRGGDSRNVVIDSPVQGAYYIDVAAAYSGTGSQFTITVRG